jgi:hypothetical protein
MMKWWLKLFYSSDLVVLAGDSKYFMCGIGIYFVCILVLHAKVRVVSYPFNLGLKAYISEING